MIFLEREHKRRIIPKKTKKERHTPLPVCRKTCIKNSFVFLPTGAAEKRLVSENRFISGFQGRVGGTYGSRVQSENPLDFRRAAFPPREWRLCRHSQLGA